MKQDHPNTVSVEELYQEEAAALTLLLDDLEDQLINTDWSDTQYYELQEEIIRITHTIEYFALRIEGYYEIRRNDG
jgi:hypothetical protein